MVFRSPSLDSPECLLKCILLGPGDLDHKESTFSVGDLGLIPGLGRSPRGGHDNPLQYSCLENPQGQMSLVGYNPWDYKELGSTSDPANLPHWGQKPEICTSNTSCRWLTWTLKSEHHSLAPVRDPFPLQLFPMKLPFSQMISIHNKEKPFKFSFFCFPILPLVQRLLYGLTHCLCLFHDV